MAQSQFVSSRPALSAMTTRPSSLSDQPVPPAAQSELANGYRRADTGPYALPKFLLERHAIDAVLIDAIRVDVGPYVPTLWRTRPASVIEVGQVAAPSNGGGAHVVDAPPMELPWIETFLEAEVTAEGSIVAEAQDTVIDGEEATSETVDQWPLDEAGAAMRAFTDDFLVHDARSPRAVDEDASRSAEPPVASTPPLPMWGDDDLMDIMPVMTTRAEADRGEHWAVHARRETERAGNSDAVALALESLARRVRDGDISVPGFTSEMGDAAALAAALAALLSIRR